MRVTSCDDIAFYVLVAEAAALMLFIFVFLPLRYIYERLYNNS
jgi:hypothetical protein